nr:H-NS family nucleoid-associated regulatory protein [Paraburkholderia tropica]
MCLRAVECEFAQTTLRFEPVQKEKPRRPAKFRHPTTGAECPGRGKPPNWIKDVRDRLS